VEAARFEIQRALILQRLGRHDEALSGYRRALPALRRAGDTLWEARLLNNRGILRAFLGDWTAAEADLVRAEQLYGDVGQELWRARVHHNLGFAAGRRGDVPAALSWFDRADEYLRTRDIPRAARLTDRCEVLISARLVGEARRIAEQAVAELERRHLASDLAEARLVLAEAALLQHDFPVAREEAERACRAFSRQQRLPWAALARHAALRAAWRGGDESATFTAARRTACALAAAGWASAALEARVIAGQIALRAGRLRVARRELEQAAAARRRGPVALRVSAWHAQALLRRAEGDRRGATAAVNAGLRLLEQHRASLGATELRAYASEHGLELATLGMQLALEQRDARRVFAAAERWRAGSLWLRPVRPPDDRRLAGDLAELRRVSAEIEQAALAGAETAELLRRQAGLEAAIRRRARRSPGLDGTVTPRVSVGALSETLGERALAEFVVNAGTLHAVVVAAGRATLHDLGPVERVASEIDWLRFGLHRLSGDAPAGRDVARSLRGMSRAASRLDEFLLEPLLNRIDGRALVVVPTAALHALPWSMLPSLHARPLTIAPSASAWQARASSTPVSLDGAVVLVAGPDVARAQAELDSLQTLYPDARRVDGDGASASAVLAAVDGARLVHVAAHGSFRADNPLFSSLRVADGPVTVYDLEALGRAPSTLVLSACESGLSGVRPGDELMGLASVLLALGTNVLVASIVPVPDDATRRLMCVFHEQLATGAPPAAALAAAQARVAGDDPASLAAAAGFLCLGGA
jgi:tetratricopeptide (TPR) repeat protein